MLVNETTPFSTGCRAWSRYRFCAWTNCHADFPSLESACVNAPLSLSFIGLRSMLWSFGYELDVLNIVQWHDLLLICEKIIICEPYLFSLPLWLISGPTVHTKGERYNLSVKNTHSALRRGERANPSHSFHLKRVERLLCAVREKRAFFLLCWLSKPTESEPGRQEAFWPSQSLFFFCVFLRSNLRTVRPRKMATEPFIGRWKVREFETPFLLFCTIFSVLETRIAKLTIPGFF